jgi:transporter family-2 protein
VKALPVWVALCVAVGGGVCSALQSAANARLGQRVDSPLMAATLNTTTGLIIMSTALLVMPSMRAGVSKLPGSGLPRWAYLGGLGGACLVTAAAYAVPTLGVAAFTIAQVAGNSLGGLAVDRSGLAPLGRIALTWPRLAGAGMGVTAVVIAQAGRPLGDLAAGLVALALAGGVAVALQSALGGRVSAVSTTSTGTLVNFIVNTPVMLVIAAVSVAVSGWPTGWPTEWYLYTGGPLGVLIVTSLVVGARTIGVLRTGLAVVGGQLAGALLLDVLLPGGPGASPALVVGSVLTMAAVGVAGLGARRRA